MEAPTDSQSLQAGRQWIPLLAAIALAVISIAGALITLREPLWIDELHTYWTCSDSLSNVAGRAQFGNQSPLWFWQDAFSLQTVSVISDSPLARQTALRLPSMLSWFATFLIIGLWLARYVRSLHKGTAILLCVVAALGILLWCDQLSWFYALEARPYATICLLCTISVLSLYRVFWGAEWIQRIIYVAASLAAIYTHYTAIIVVGCAWMGALLTCRERSKDVNKTAKQLLSDFLIVILLAIPAFAHLLQIGQSRQLWNSFAGNTNWSSVRALVPIDSWLIIAALFWYMQRYRNKNKVDHASYLAFGLSVATCLCVLTVWGLGVSGIAPLIHSRYVLGSYPLLFLAVGILLLQLNSMRMMFLASGLMAITWMFSQGGPTTIRYDAPVAWQRNENWPSAVEAVEQELEGSDLPLALAPMLVETASVESINGYGRDQLCYAWMAAKKLYGGPAKELKPVAPPILLTNSIESWGDELELAKRLENFNNSKVLIVARAQASKVQPWIEKLLSNASLSRFQVKQLFGNDSQRLCVFLVQEKISEQRP